MKFRNPYNPDDRVRVIHSSGSENFIKYGWTYDDGELVYCVKDIEPMYEKIQAERDSVDLQAILARYEAGDSSALNKVQGMYIDAVDLPKTYADIFKAAQDATEIFNAMPTAIKEQYDNNPAEYWRDFGTESFDNVMNEYRASVLNSHGLADMRPVDSVQMVKDSIKVGDTTQPVIEPIEKKGADE